MKGLKHIHVLVILHVFFGTADFKLWLGSDVLEILPQASYKSYMIFGPFPSDMKL